MITEIRHSAANEVIASSIFVGAADFRDIGERTARIETDAACHEKGKVFEVFAEALLANPATAADVYCLPQQDAADFFHEHCQCYRQAAANVEALYRERRPI